jgi:hypothetical protein
MDSILKMENHVRKSEVLHGTKMLHCATICWTKCPKNLVLELLGFLQNSKLIPLLQLRNFLFLIHGRVHEHLKFSNEHLRLQVIVKVGLNFLQFFCPKTHITTRDLCKMPTNVPFSHVPLPSQSILASLQEICHLIGERLHNRAWLPYLQKL